MVQNAAVVPVFYDIDRVMSSRAITLGPLPREKYKALFAQYFRFDALDQQSFLLRSTTVDCVKLCWRNTFWTVDRE